MIPNYQQFMRSFLQIANDANGNEVKLRNVINQLADQFGLTDEERSETLPSGRQSILDNRVGWARTYLTKAGLLEATRRAHFVITPRGKEALSEDVDINNEYLKKFDEFIVFKQKSNDGVGTENNSDNIEHEELSTPDEILRAAYKKVNEALAQDILERTRKVTPDFFEDLLIELLIAMGYGGAGEGAAHALGKSGDNGVDGVIDQDPLGVDQIYIQAKRYAEGNNVGAGDIRNFFGALNLKRAQKGIFITTSDFTSSAQDTANNLGTRIVLINGKELAKLMLRYNIGSRDEDVLHIKKIDEDFFEV
ncbi:restriction endonuclease [uncultured Pseudoalteromonas sp.]|uniref:restriction endonuclease n=1 Tax=uncultured Pseudoalteromonas sp. TaxID=114053 RepID=UPI0030D7310E